MPRFVVLEHDHPELHWDLMLEAGDVLWNWRLPAPIPAVGMTALRTPDHRLLYLEYEGPVSGNRGHVTRWDQGSFTWLEAGPAVVSVVLEGGRLRGVLRLVCGEGANWRVSDEPG